MSTHMDKAERLLISWKPTNSWNERYSDWRLANSKKEVDMKGELSLATLIKSMHKELIVLRAEHMSLRAENNKLKEILTTFCKAVDEDLYEELIK